MVNIKELSENKDFKIVKINIDNNKGRVVIDSKGSVYAEIKKDNIDDPEEFEQELEDYKNEFEKVMYKTTIRGNKYYLYEVYIEGVQQEFN